MENKSLEAAKHVLKLDYLMDNQFKAISSLPGGKDRIIWQPTGSGS